MLLLSNQHPIGIKNSECRIEFLGSHFTSQGTDVTPLHDSISQGQGSRKLAVVIFGVIFVLTIAYHCRRVIVGYYLQWSQTRGHSECL